MMISNFIFNDDLYFDASNKVEAEKKSTMVFRQFEQFIYEIRRKNIDIVLVTNE